MHPLITYDVHRHDLRHSLERSLARPDDRSARPRAHVRPSGRDDARGRPPDPPGTAPDPPGATPGPTPPAAGRPACPPGEEVPARRLVAVAP